MQSIKAAQALAIFDAIDDSLHVGECVLVGRAHDCWFARLGNTTVKGVSPKDALAQLAQTMLSRVESVVLPEHMTMTLRRVREARNGFSIL